MVGTDGQSGMLLHFTALCIRVQLYKVVYALNAVGRAQAAEKCFKLWHPVIS